MSRTSRARIRSLIRGSLDGGLVAIRHHSSKWGDYRTGTEKHHDPLPEGAEWLGTSTHQRWRGGTDESTRFTELCKKA